MAKLVEHHDDIDGFAAPAAPLPPAQAAGDEAPGGPGSTEVAGGLSSAEAAERLGRFGPNAVVEVPPRTWFMLAHRFWGVIPWMLEAAVVIDVVLGRYAEDGVISLDQYQLTGESLPVEARAGATAFTGSKVVRGEASGIVTATAGRTQFGKTAQLVQLARAPKRLQLLTVSIAKYLLALDVVLIAIVIVAAVIKGTTLSNTLPFALVLLVASAPVTLPAMFTMSASMGAANLSKNEVPATRLSAIEDAGRWTSSASTRPAPSPRTT
jgi:hypothetical protein